MHGIVEQEPDRSLNEPEQSRDDVTLEGENALDLYLTGIASNIGAIAVQARAMSDALAELRSRLKEATTSDRQGDKR